MKDSQLLKVRKIAERVAQEAREAGVQSQWAEGTVSYISPLKRRVQFLAAITAGQTVYGLKGLVLYLKFPRRAHKRRVRSLGGSSDRFYGEVICVVTYNHLDGLSVILANGHKKHIGLRMIIKGLFPDIFPSLPRVDSSEPEKRSESFLADLGLDCMSDDD